MSLLEDLIGLMEQDYKQRSYLCGRSNTPCHSITSGPFRDKDNEITTHHTQDTVIAYSLVAYSMGLGPSYLQLIIKIVAVTSSVDPGRYR